MTARVAGGRGAVKACLGACPPAGRRSDRYEGGGSAGFPVQQDMPNFPVVPRRDDAADRRAVPVSGTADPTEVVTILRPNCRSASDVARSADWPCNARNNIRHASNTTPPPACAGSRMSQRRIPALMMASRTAGKPSTRATQNSKQSAMAIGPAMARQPMGSSRTSVTIRSHGWSTGRATTSTTPPASKKTASERTQSAARAPSKNSQVPAAIAVPSRIAG